MSTACKYPYYVCTLADLVDVRHIFNQHFLEKMCSFKSFLCSRTLYEREVRVIDHG